MTLQTSKRILCCLLAVIMLFMFFMRPIAVSATSAAAMAGFVGIAPEVAIPLVLAVLGLAYVCANAKEIYYHVRNTVSDIFTDVDGEMLFPAYTYNNELYMSQDYVEAVGESISTLCEWKYADAWELGQEFSKMYTITFENSAYEVVCWADSPPYLGETNNTIIFPDHCVVYYYTTASHVQDYRNGVLPGSEYNYLTLNPNVLTGCYATDIYETDVETIITPIIIIDESVISKKPDPEDPDDKEEMLVPIAPAHTTPYTETNTQVEVEPNTGTTTTPGTSLVDLSGVISWLQSIWSAITSLASKIYLPIVNAISTGINTLTDWLSDIIEWLQNTGITITNILEWIKTLPSAIAQAISGVLENIFVPSADFITEKVEALRTRFNWIDPIIVFCESMSSELSGSTPPVIYVHLDDAEGSYNYGGTVKFLDMTWYARYKAQGDAILSGFFWAIFCWRMYMKLPGIINGVGGSIGRMSTGYRREDE